MSADDVAAPLPTVGIVTARLRTPALEVVAIAAAVLALMLSFLLWFEVPAELIWLAVLALAANRRHLLKNGHDLVLVAGQRPRR